MYKHITVLFVCIVSVGCATIDTEMIDYYQEAVLADVEELSGSIDSVEENTLSMEKVLNTMDATDEDVVTLKALNYSSYAYIREMEESMSRYKSHVAALNEETTAKIKSAGKEIRQLKRIIAAIVVVSVIVLTVITVVVIKK